jgi:DNA processing protein
VRSPADDGALFGPDVVAACALSTVPAVGASTLLRIARTFGSLRAALEAGPRELLERNAELKLAAEARAYLLRDPGLRELGLWAASAARSAGARVVLFGDAAYPARLREIGHPPQLLYVRGQFSPDARRIAVVGSREADENGREIARGFGDALARAGVCVVSGGARGIDTSAHEGAIWGGGSTIAVLGCGIDVAYPPQNAGLLDRIADGAGAVVSEFAPGTGPLQRNFPRRNRTIAGLSDGVVIVRAALRSGALITADHAAQQGRMLFAVPGDVGQPLAEGPNELLRLDAAFPATSALDVFERLRWPVPEALARPPSRSEIDPVFAASDIERGREELPDQAIDAQSLGLWESLDDRTPAHVDDLARRAGLGAQETLGRLLDLELKGMCVQRPGKYFLRR